MTQIVQVLVDEHKRIRRMLLCFEEELNIFERAEKSDYEILEGSIAYCQEYLDQWHHPREDVLLDLLQRRSPEDARDCESLEDQHLRLARSTKELVKVFEAVERDAMFPRAAIVEMGRTLIGNYRSHLDWEECSFFPVVTAHLSFEDWQDIAKRFADAADPLADNPVDRRYRALFRAIDDA